MTPERAAALAPGLADDAARARAVAARNSVLVRAPAGSGKTELLIQRFLRVLGEVEEPEAVVALTFTRKAAAEMRARLLAALAAAAEPAAAPPATAHARQTRALAEAALRQDQARGWDLLASPNRLRVLTLDALALELVARMPWLSRLGAAPAPTDDPQAMYAAASRAALERIEAAAGTRGAESARFLLRRMAADLDGAERLLADLLGRRDQWLGALSADPASLHDELQDALTAALEAETAGVRERLAQAGVDGADLPPDADAGAWRALAERVLTKDGKPRQRGPHPRLDAAAAAALHGLRAIPEAAVPAGQAQAIGNILDLLAVAMAALAVAFRDTGACDFVEITLAALRALGDDAAPTELAFGLDARIQHLFVDEFQDTSRAQHRLLHRLVADWQPDDGRTLFLVGDPMQSIYGFRNAEVELFVQAERTGQLGPLSLECLRLGRNFRSGPALVAWCNQQFRSAAAGVPFAPAEAAQVTPAGIHVHALEAPQRPALLEAVLVADLVESALAERGDQAEVAILGHNRKALAAILPELHRRGIRFRGDKLLRLADSPVVADLMALTRALHDPADRVAWLAVLRAPWCGLVLRDLHALCAGDRDRTVAELWAERQPRLTTDGRERAARTLRVLQAAAAQRQRLPMRRLVAWCWQALAGDGCVADAANPADANAFLELIERFDTKGPALDLAELEAAVEGLLSPPDPGADQRVLVTTAHQAKGLEFDTVILPGLDRCPSSSRSELLRWYPLAGNDAEDPEHLLIAAKPEINAAEDEAPFYNFAGSLKQRRNREEQARLLYVACTRARRRLYLVAWLKRNKEGNLGVPDIRSPLHRIWDTAQGEFVADLQRQNTDAGRNELTRLGREIRQAVPEGPPRLRRLTGAALATLAPVAEAAAPEAPGAGWRAERPGSIERAVGIAVHALLRQMAERGDLRWETRRLRLLLRAEGVPDAGLRAAEARATQALEATVGDERGQWILAAHDGARCEWPITGVIHGRVVDHVVDRSFVDADGTRWIIDYKTAAPEGDRERFLDQQAEQYRGQLATYAALVGALETRPIRCALYFPAIAGWRELA